MSLLFQITYIQHSSFHGLQFYFELSPRQPAVVNLIGMMIPFVLLLALPSLDEVNVNAQHKLDWNLRSLLPRSEKKEKTVVLQAKNPPFYFPRALSGEAY